MDTNPENGELGLLRSIRHRANQFQGRGGVRLGIGDDCALLRPRPGEELAVTTDLSLAGRHFRLDWHPAEAVGHRTLARGLSDLAAMGARPVAAFLSLGVPRDLTLAGAGSPSWVDRFLNGFFDLANACKTPLAGGDLAESPLALADIVLVGAVPRGRALLRSRARPGDLLYVTGSLGGAAAGLALLAQNGEKPGRAAPPMNARNEFPELLRPHFYPQPRIAQGEWLRRRRLATAALDVSDGLSTDLAHLCQESGVTAVVEADWLPRAEAASLAQALHGGEDYEILFTARPNARIPGLISGVAVTRIGRIEDHAPGKPLVSLATGCTIEPLPAQGWEHFSHEG
jgi:thiamine-monophosphate kinase